MENKSINRYNTFCKSLKNLEKSRYADPSADFVLEGTVLNFSLTFDIAWCLFAVDDNRKDQSQEVT